MEEFSNSSTICAVLENRAREICICKISMNVLSTLEVHLVSDCHSYVETMMLLESLAPHEILLRDGTVETVLTKKINRYIQSVGTGTRLLFISRQYFDQDRGYELLKKVVAGVIDADIVAKYVVLAGSFALLRYVENVLQQSFLNNSMRLVIGHGNSGGRMLIDRRTAINLELVNNACSGKQKDSVFGCIDHTRTVVGARFLRSTLLSPLNSVSAINMRLDFVEQLIGNRMGLIDCIEVLVKFPDLDKMLAGLCVQAKNFTPKTVRLGIDTLIYIKHSLLLAPSLVASLNCVKYEIAAEPIGNESTRDESLILSMIMSMSNPNYSQILNCICEHLTDSTAFSRNQHEMRHTECFAIRPGLNSFLDLARSTFLQSVEDIYALAQTYTSSAEGDVKVAYSTSRGYFLQISSYESELPGIFIQAVQNRRTISCTTLELASLSDRACEAIGTALRITNELIQDLMAVIRNHSDTLFVFVDSIALLDVLCSFAELANKTPSSFSRPIITESGPMVVSEGRHIILMCLEEQSRNIFGHLVSNDTYLSPLDSFQIITGCNGAGKSIYIKQVALIVVMAQIGCFVPAVHATIPLRDRILSRIGMSDDMEHNLSSFHTEMKECSYILDNITPKSLGIIDELGRGTSNSEGFAIAMAVAESLIDSDAYCLFVTHFRNIVMLEEMYLTVRNVHIGGDAPSHQELNSPIEKMHKLGTGPSMIESGYGIDLAEKCGFPEKLIANARMFAKKLEHLQLVTCERKVVDPNIAILSSLLDNLLMLKNSSLTDDGLKAYLHRLKAKMTSSQFNVLKIMVTKMYQEAQARDSVIAETLITTEVSARVDKENNALRLSVPVAAAAEKPLASNSLTRSSHLNDKIDQDQIKSPPPKRSKLMDSGLRDEENISHVANQSVHVQAAPIFENLGADGTIIEANFDNVMKAYDNSLDIGDDLMISVADFLS